MDEIASKVRIFRARNIAGVLSFVLSAVLFFLAGLTSKFTLAELLAPWE